MNLKRKHESKYYITTKFTKIMDNLIYNKSKTD